MAGVGWAVPGLDTFLRWFGEAGEPVHSGETNKHRRDVFRLCSLFEPGLRIELPGRVADDVRLFLEEVELPPRFVKDIGLSAFTADELKGMIARAYLQEE